MPAAKATVVDLLMKLSERFDPTEVKVRTQGGQQLDFISIDSTIRRFNDVLGTGWSTTDVSYDVNMMADGNFAVVVSLTLNALDKSAVGVGGDKAKDLDKAIKTALAEALKKAGHQFGVGLYLWLEEERNAIAVARDGGVYDPLLTIKRKVADLAIVQGLDDLSATGIATHFGVSVEDLQDETALKRILDGATVAV